MENGAVASKACFCNMYSTWMEIVCVCVCAIQLVLMVLLLLLLLFCVYVCILNASDSQKSQTHHTVHVENVEGFLPISDIVRYVPTDIQSKIQKYLFYECMPTIKCEKVFFFAQKPTEETNQELERKANAIPYHTIPCDAMRCDTMPCHEPR